MFHAYFNSTVPESSFGWIGSIPEQDQQVNLDSYLINDDDLYQTRIEQTFDLLSHNPVYPGQVEHSPPNLTHNSPQSIAQEHDSPLFHSHHTTGRLFDYEVQELLNSQLLQKAKPGRKRKSESSNHSRPKTAQELKQDKLEKNKEAAQRSRRRKREKLNVMELYSQKLCMENFDLKKRALELLHIQSISINKL